ncbi:MAG TPA: polysaccharide biosynthesis tyrosine autokinase [Gammaproteobacteria bacterium]|nr:polysaccharide biosynthesis tyrosine autokinase [Gammaproteobacteria bacterium]
MERIKKALEKARKDREKQKLSQSRQTNEQHSPAQPAGAGQQVSGETTAGEITPDSRIEYTSTRKIHISPEVLRDNHIIINTINDLSASAYNLLRTRVLQQMREHNWNTLAITSSLAGEGKTLTAINLAISLAREVNNTVLLVDLDLRRPTIHRYMGFEPEYGLSDYLQKGTQLENILVNPGIERLVILPGNKEISNSSEMLSSPKMKGLVEELKSRYQSRLILFDLPPLLAIDDALAFSPFIDSMLMVIEDEKTTEDELKRAFDMLHNVNVIGTMLNKSIASQKQYGYY